MNSIAALLVAIVLGLGTLALRVGSGLLRQRLVLPGRLEEALEWLPVATLAAMIAPVFAPSDLAEKNVEVLVAATITAWIGFKTRNLFLSVALGLLAIWLFHSF